jgi:hypothetical protein
MQGVAMAVAVAMAAMGPLADVVLMVWMQPDTLVELMAAQEAQVEMEETQQMVPMVATEDSSK